MIAKLLEVFVPFFLQIVLGLAVLGWIVSNEEKNKDMWKKYVEEKSSTVEITVTHPFLATCWCTTQSWVLDILDNVICEITHNS